MIISNLQIKKISSIAGATDISAVIGIIFDDSGQILLIKNSRGWDFPGGHLDPHESPEEALHREVMEEACVSISNPIPFLAATSDRTMIFYTANVGNVYPFVAEHETSDRTFIPSSDFTELYSGGIPDLARYVYNEALKKLV